MHKTRTFAQILPSKFLLSPDAVSVHAAVLKVCIVVLESLLLQTVIFLGFWWSLKQI